MGERPADRDQEKALTTTSVDEYVAVLSPDGSRVAFGCNDQQKKAIFAVRFGDNRAVRVCNDCGEPRTYLPDGQGILYQSFSASGVSLISKVDAAAAPPR